MSFFRRLFSTSRQSGATAPASESTPVEEQNIDRSTPEAVSPSTVEFFTRDSLIQKFMEIRDRGWVENTQKGNDGAAGNILENLLGIPTNNIPIPDASGWELKTQSKNTQSLISLSHKEPEPRNERVVQRFLTPNYGWSHADAGGKYPADEKSFRQTMNGATYTDRGFKVTVNRNLHRLEVEFNSAMVSTRHQGWLDMVKARVGNLGPLAITPYWNFNDLYLSIGRKFYNCFLVRYDVKRENGKEYFHYNEAYMLKNVDIDKFIDCIESGKVKVEFDARTHHNHGTKMRMFFRDIPYAYKEVSRVM